MSKFKIAVILMLVLVIATPLCVLVIQRYQQTRAVVDARHEQELQERLSQIDAKEKAEIEANKKAQEEQKRKDRKRGLKDEEPDQVIRGLTMDMQQADTGDGGRAYFYVKPDMSGVFVQPYVVQRGKNNAELRVFVCYIGQAPVDLNRIEIMVSNDDKFPIKAQGEIKSIPHTEGIMQYFDQQASAEDEKTLRILGSSGAGKILLPTSSSSNDDRLLSAKEVVRVSDMLQLYDILSGKKTTDD